MKDYNLNIDISFILSPALRLIIAVFLELLNVEGVALDCILDTKRILDKWIASVHNKNDFIITKHLNMFFATLKKTLVWCLSNRSRFIRNLCWCCIVKIIAIQLTVLCQNIEHRFIMFSHKCMISFYLLSMNHAVSYYN